MTSIMSMGAMKAMSKFLTDEQCRQFWDDGWLLVEDVLDPDEDLAPLFREYAGVLDRLTTALYLEGRLDSMYADLPFSERLIRVCSETGAVYSAHFNISWPQVGIQPDSPGHFGPAVFRILTHPRLLDVAEGLIGPEIYSHPAQNVRIKLPGWVIPHTASANTLVSATPWHQDNGALMPEADETQVLTVWLALNDATIANGCLQLIPGSHRHGLITHCHGNSMHIPERYLPGAPLTVPVRAGGLLLLHRRTVHASLENTTEEIRWSLDLRYQPTGQPTGRSVFPGFVARSTARPESVTHSPEEWLYRWLEARAILSHQDGPVFTRWQLGDPACA